MTRLTHLPMLGLAAALALASVPARAAESYDNCTGFIEALPATIATPGTWCLRGQRYTSITSGAAITIAANDVTIDCNDFRLSGLGGGAATNAVGIDTDLKGFQAFRRNAIVRNCRVQGFWTGIRLHGAGHVVEHNHVDASTYIGLQVDGRQRGLNIVRHNRVTDTGGRPGQNEAIAIDAAHARVQDNTVNGVVPAGAGDRRDPVGIRVAFDMGSLAQRNRVSGLVTSGAGRASGFRPSGAVLRDNEMIQAVPTPGYGSEGDLVRPLICRNNDIQRYADDFGARCRASGNLFQP